MLVAYHANTIKQKSRLFEEQTEMFSGLKNTLRRSRKEKK